MRNPYYASPQSAETGPIWFKKKKKKGAESSSPGGLWEEAENWGWAWERDFQREKISKGKDFQSVYIFVTFKLWNWGVFRYIEPKTCCLLVNM